MPPAIKVDNVSKLYRIGENQVAEYKTLRDSLVHGVRRSMRHLTGAFRRSSSEQSDERDHWALRDVSFEVQPGEVVGIVGRNGAGKSTLLKILSRITEPTSGRLELRGRVVSLLEVGTGFHQELTGRENIFLNGAILGMTHNEMRRKFDEIVAFAEIDKFLDTPVKRYSSGMYVRLGFAVAAHLDPDILLVDEVLAVGDAAFQKKCLGKMDEVSRGGRTVLFVSHNIVTIKALCQRGILLDRGRVTCADAIDAVIDRYLAVGDMHLTGIIPPDAPRIGTGRGRLLSVKLIDESGRQAVDVYLGQPVRVQFDVELFDDVNDALLEVSVSTPDGTHVLCSMTRDQGGPVNLTRGVHSVTASIDTVLLPRHYCIDLGIHHADGRTIDFVQRTLDFSVLRVGKHDSESYPWFRVRGLVRAPASWHIADRAAGAQHGETVLGGKVS